MIKTTLCIILATVFLFAPQAGDCVSGNPVLEGDDVSFNKVTSTEGFVSGAEPTPGYIGDDNDTTVETEDWHIWGNATDTGTGTEDVDVYLQTQINSVLTSVFHVDADGDFNILALDLNVANDVYAKGIHLADADVSPNAVGEVVYDNNVTDQDDGSMAWYDDDEIKYIVSIPSGSMPGAAEDDYQVTYDAATDKYYFKVDADSGGATALDDIGDPDAATSITCANDETLTFLSSEDTGTFLSIQDDDVALAGSTILEELHFSGTTYDGTSDAIYLNMKDYTTTAYTFSGAQFSCYRPMISYEANVAGGGYEAFTVSQNLEAMDDAADICTGFYVGWTNADHSAGILQAFNAEDITGDAQSTEKAFRVGTGWDHAFNAESGDFSTSHALDWDLIDNNAAGISFGATDKAGILRVVTTDAGEGVTMSGTLAVTDAVTFDGGAIVANGATVTFDETDGDPNDCDVRLSANDGVLTILGVNGANNESLTIDVDQTADAVVVGTGTGATEINTTLQFVTTGDIMGGVNVALANGAVTMGSSDLHAQYGTLWISDTAAPTLTWTTLAAGMSGCLTQGAGRTDVLTLDALAGDVIVLDGVAGNAGETIASTGAAGDKVCWVAQNATNIYITSTSGTWGVP